MLSNPVLQAELIITEAELFKKCISTHNPDSTLHVLLENMLNTVAASLDAFFDVP